MKMKRRNRNYIDDMVDQFGYDYVIGYCLCSAYNLKNLAENEEDEEKAFIMMRKSNRFSEDASRLSKERFEYGL